jgi:phosphatidylinositol-3-phosphatase
MRGRGSGDRVAIHFAIATLLLTALGTLVAAVPVTAMAGSVRNIGEKASSLPNTQTVGRPMARRISEDSSRLEKILIIMDENHSVGQVFPSAMPYLWSLATRYGRATHWSDVGHPSLPNYLAIFGGSNFHDPQDCSPVAGCTYPGPSVFGQAEAHGESARAYEESMPGTCNLGYSGEYDVNHNPWAYFPSERSACRVNDVASGNPSRGRLRSDIEKGALPNVGLVTPNLLDDAHDGSLARADAWLRTWIPLIMSGPDWRAGRLAIVVVFDEGETTEQVPFVLMALHMKSVIVHRPLNQYSLTRLIDEITGSPLLRDAASATDIAPLFGLHV